jgi:hypothetical protein
VILTQHMPEGTRPCCLSPYLIDSLMQKIINFSQGKDKMLKASLPRVLEAIDLEELARVLARVNRN